MIVLGLAGNGFVLYATVRYNAIELDRASVLYLQNLAVADILILIFYSLPFLLVLISRRWIIGEILCYLTFYITCIAGFVDNFTILGISCYRVWVLLCPFRFVSCSIYLRENPNQNSLCMQYNQHFVSGLLHFSLPGSP